MHPLSISVIVLSNPQPVTLPNVFLSANQSVGYGYTITHARTHPLIFNLTSRIPALRAGYGSYSS